LHCRCHGWCDPLGPPGKSSVKRADGIIDLR
jgi:hypothetical protein